MAYIRFEWDPRKNASNLAKHKISFDEAQTAFHDPFARIIPDDAHSTSEERFILLGLSRHLHVLVVCHCYKASDEIIRIISARKATRTEAASYGGPQ